MDRQFLQNNNTNNIEKVHHILVIEDSIEKKTIELTLSNYSIGRHSDNDIVIACQKASRYHATLLRRTDLKNNQYSYWLLDGDLQGNKSRNGIVINDKKSLIHELKDGDVIKFSAEARAKYYVKANLLEISESDNSFALKKRVVETPNNDRESVIDGKTVYPITQEKFANAYSEQEFASFAELCPLPVVEIDLYGQIKFLNSAAKQVFPDIYQQKINHPILKNLIAQCNINNDSVFNREVTIAEKKYQQISRYFSASKTIRSYLVDLTRENELNLRLAKQKALFSTVTGKIAEGVFLVDEDSKNIIEANSISSSLLGYTVDEMLQLTIYDLSYERGKLATSLQLAINNKNGLYGTCLLKHRNGSTVNTSIKIELLGCEGAKVFCIIVDKISEALNLNEEYTTDKLTYKYLFELQLLTAIANNKRYQKKLAVMFLDLGLLPETEKYLGSNESDFLVSNIEERLNNTLRSGDTVVRWKQNRFALLLSAIEEPEEVIKVCIRIQKSLSQPFKVGTQLVIVDSNIGIAIYPQDGTDLNTLLNNVEVALNRAKKKNKSYQFFDSNTNSQAAIVLRLENLLHQAVEREEFELCYRPQISVEKEEIRFLAAAIEWNLKSGDFSATSIMEIAAKTGLIIPLGEWAIAAACKQSKIWQERRITPLKISIDLAAVQFQQSSLPATIERIVTETKFDPALLELNIGMAAISKDLEHSRRTITDLRKLGVKISLHNLASDFYSLEMLQQLTVDTLKIDRTSIQELKEKPQKLSIIAALVEIGKRMELDVVVEGVETESQVELLGSLQYERLQCFWFSPERSTAEITQILDGRFLSLEP